MKRLITMLVVASVSASAQSFEVASIRPHRDGSDVATIEAPGRLDATLTLKYMIELAYDLAPNQISGGPDWLDKTAWDITAKAQGFKGEIPLEALRPMLQELIRDRFQLRVRAAKQSLPHFALLIDKQGAKLKPSTETKTEFRLERGPVLTWTKVSMKQFASWLAPYVQPDRVVLDETGLHGEYDLQLRWTGSPMAAGQVVEGTGPTIFTALREQLGLRLEARRGPVDTLIVDRAELPSEN